MNNVSISTYKGMGLSMDDLGKDIPAADLLEGELSQPSCPPLKNYTYFTRYKTNLGKQQISTLVNDAFNASVDQNLTINSSGVTRCRNVDCAVYNTTSAGRVASVICFRWTSFESVLRVYDCLYGNQNKSTISSIFDTLFEIIGINKQIVIKPQYDANNDIVFDYEETIQLDNGDEIEVDCNSKIPMEYNDAGVCIDAYLYMSVKVQKARIEGGKKAIKSLKQAPKVKNTRKPSNTPKTPTTKTSKTSKTQNVSKTVKKSNPSKSKTSKTTK
jgi:hypothetical protein